jgi:hypothetical protein
VGGGEGEQGCGLAGRIDMFFVFRSMAIPVLPTQENRRLAMRLLTPMPAANRSFLLRHSIWLLPDADDAEDESVLFRDSSVMIRSSGGTRIQDSQTNAPFSSLINQTQRAFYRKVSSSVRYALRFHIDEITTMMFEPSK